MCETITLMIIFYNFKFIKHFCKDKKHQKTINFKFFNQQK